MNNELLKFDSKEEEYFYYWLEELKNYGFIINIIHQPLSFNLSDKIDGIKNIINKNNKNKNKKFTLLREHIYTSDFYIIWSEKAKNILFSFENNYIENTLIAYKDDDIYFSYIEVKPEFDKNNMTRLFKINQKWIYLQIKYILI